MPSAKKRIALTVPEDLDKGLRDLSDATGKPVSTICVELLVEMTPMLADLVKLARMAQQGKKRAAEQRLATVLDGLMVEGRALQRTLPLAKKRARRK